MSGFTNRLAPSWAGSRQPLMWPQRHSAGAVPRQLAQLTLASTMLSSISFRRLAAASNSGFSLCSSKLALLKHANAQADFL